MTLLVDDGKQDVGGWGTPDLCRQCALARTEKSLGALVLLDPFEKYRQFATLLVQCSGGQLSQDRIRPQMKSAFPPALVFV